MAGEVEFYRNRFIELFDLKARVNRIYNKVLLERGYSFGDMDTESTLEFILKELDHGIIHTAKDFADGVNHLDVRS